MNNHVWYLDLGRWEKQRSSKIYSESKARDGAVHQQAWLAAETAHAQGFILTRAV